MHNNVHKYNNDKTGRPSKKLTDDYVICGSKYTKKNLVSDWTYFVFGKQYMIHI